jgi:ABC-type protease/lipase transport system fused ATPase/permease subunit
VPLRGEKDATNLRGTHDGNNDKKAVLAAAKAAGLGPLLARLPLGLNTPVGEVRGRKY